MLRICHFASGDAWAGTESHLACLLPELARLPGLHVCAILLNDGLLAQQLRENHIHVSVFPEVYLSATSLIKRIRQLLHEMQTVLLHTHGYKQNILGAIAGRLAHVPWILRTEHGVYEHLSGWGSIRMRIYRTLDLLAAHRCSAIVTVSEALAAQWRLDLNGQDSRITLVPNGVHIPPELHPKAVAQARARLGIGEDQVIFGTLGRIVPVKGLNDLLKAVVILHQQGKRCVFLIAGDGPIRVSLEARAAELGLQKVVRFLGFTPKPAEVLAALDVFVLPSLNEGVPMALLEALALGKPAVATAVGGVAEFLSHGVHALLVQPGAPAELAQACERLIVDPALRERLGRQARCLIREQLSAERMATEIHDLYCKLIKQND